ncbi:MAG TPA: cytochrome c biogenesis CcdA family protein [Proteiniclasticum sp.]|nr:cytochrome c biogenesis CcdA family protein [Proteiniclasticum sp.]
MDGLKLALLFFEGVLTFISPCILPMFPVFLMYLSNESQKMGKALVINILGFILGFTIVFVTLGATATAIGSIMNQNRVLLQRIGGVIIILFGLNMAGFINIRFLNFQRGLSLKKDSGGFLSSMIFGIVFSFGWSPCLGLFLGTALILAADASTVGIGMFYLFVFSMGLGLPFLITGILFSKVEQSFNFVKKHYNLITKISGIFLVIIGILMALDLFGYYARFFNF